MLGGTCLLPRWLFVSFGVYRNFWDCVRGRKKSNWKGRTEEKKVAECIHLRRVDCWKSKCKRERVCVLSLEVKMDRMSSWKTRAYVGNPCHAVGSKCAGQNQSADVVVSTNHVTFLTNRFPRLISLPTSAIFVSGTRGITAILKYRSVNPISLLNISVRISLVSLPAFVTP